MEVIAHEIEYLNEDRVSYGIEDLVAVFAVHDNLPAPQDRQVLGKVRLFKAELFLNRSRGIFPVAQQLEDGDAGGMGKGLKDARLVSTQRVLHNLNIFD